MLMEVNVAKGMCGMCCHYHQHYVQADFGLDGYIPCYSGHCSYPRMKNRKPMDQCENYIEKSNLGKIVRVIPVLEATAR